MSLRKYNLEQILDLLDKHHQRATYGAIAKLVGVRPQDLMKLPGTPKRNRSHCHRDSWVVAARSHFPTNYKRAEMHPALEERDEVLDTPAKLKVWLANVTG